MYKPEPELKLESKVETKSKINIYYIPKAKKNMVDLENHKSTSSKWLTNI